MFSPRGLLMLAQTHHEVRGYLRTVHANTLQGVETEWIGPEQVKDLVPIINIDGPRYPVLGALYQARGGTARHDAVAWGYARACSQMGMDIIQQCEVTGVRSENGAVTGVETTKGFIGTQEARHRRRRPLRPGRRNGRLPPADRGCGAAGARLGTDQALHGCGRDGQHRARLHVAIRQGRDGDRRRHRRLQQLHPARLLPPYRGNPARAGRNLPDDLAPQDAAAMGRHRRHDRRPLAADLENPARQLLHQLRLGHRRLQGDPRLRLGDGRTDGQGRTRPAGRRLRHRAVPRGPLHRRSRLRQGWRIDDAGSPLLGS